MPDKDQVTPWFELSLATVAENGWLCPVCTDEVAGDRVTLTGVAAVTVIVAVAVFVVSATDVAVKVTDAGFGTLAGAV